MYRVGKKNINVPKKLYRETPDKIPTVLIGEKWKGVCRNCEGIISIKADFLDILGKGLSVYCTCTNCHDVYEIYPSDDFRSLSKEVSRVRLTASQKQLIARSPLPMSKLLSEYGISKQSYYNIIRNRNT